MNKFIDLKVEDFVEAYRKSGLTPVDQSFYSVISKDGNEIKCGCALTALAYGNHCQFLNGEEVIRGIESIYTDTKDDYYALSSFILGFDNYSSRDDTNVEYFEFGKKVREAVVKEFGIWSPVTVTSSPYEDQKLSSYSYTKPEEVV